MARIEHLMKEGIYRVVVMSYSPILSLRVRIPARAGFGFVAHILSPVLYSIYPLYRLSGAFLGLTYITQKCLEFDSTGCVQVWIDSSRSTRRSHFPAHVYVGCRMLRVYSNGSGLGAPTPGRIVFGLAKWPTIQNSYVCAQLWMRATT